MRVEPAGIHTHSALMYLYNQRARKTFSYGTLGNDFLGSLTQVFLNQLQLLLNPNKISAGVVMNQESLAT